MQWSLGVIVQLSQLPRPESPAAQSRCQHSRRSAASSPVRLRDRQGGCPGARRLSLPPPPTLAPGHDTGPEGGDPGFIDHRVHEWPLLSQMTCHRGSVRTAVTPRKIIPGHGCKGYLIRVSTCFPLKEREFKLPVQSSTFRSLLWCLYSLSGPGSVPLPMLHEDRDDLQATCFRLPFAPLPS